MVNRLCHLLPFQHLRLRLPDCFTPRSHPRPTRRSLPPLECILRSFHPWRLILQVYGYRNSPYRRWRRLDSTFWHRAGTHTLFGRSTSALCERRLCDLFQLTCSSDFCHTGRRESYGELT